jgi:hypothetical protein
VLIAKFFFQLLHPPFDDFFLGRGAGGQMRKEEKFIATHNEFSISYPISSGAISNYFLFGKIG